MNPSLSTSVIITVWFSQLVLTQLTRRAFFSSAFVRLHRLPSSFFLSFLFSFLSFPHHRVFIDWLPDCAQLFVFFILPPSFSRHFQSTVINIIVIVIIDDPHPSIHRAPYVSYMSFFLFYGRFLFFFSFL